MLEKNITKLILIKASKLGARLFRNNTGTGWVGKIKRTKGGGIYIEEPRPLIAGLCVGSSDLIGWTEKIITKDMVGEKIAIFTALEIKTPRGKPSKEQLNFIRIVNDSGGIAGIAKNIEDAENIILKNEQP